MGDPQSERASFEASERWPQGMGSATCLSELALHSVGLLIAIDPVCQSHEWLVAGSNPTEGGDRNETSQG
jgi:hypothetical protein